MKIKVIVKILIWQVILLILIDSNGSFAQVNEFLRLRGNKFMHEDSVYYPKTVNYAVRIRHDCTNTTYQYIAPAWNYDLDPYCYECFSADACSTAIVEDFRFIKDSLGCNSIRLTGLKIGAYQYSINDIKYWSNGAFYITENKDSPQCYPMVCYWPLNSTHTDNIERYLQQLDVVMNIANNMDIKILFLVGGDKIYEKENQANADFKFVLPIIAERYKNQSALFAYDFFNEPLQNALIGNSADKWGAKCTICQVVDEWNEIVKTRTHYQYTTIGLEYSLEVFYWDPGILNLDFFAFHVYPYFHTTVPTKAAFERPKSEMAWMERALIKPWMIGEVGFSASPSDEIDCDDGTILEQEDYIEQYLRQCKVCAGSGFMWWDYQDHRYNEIDPEKADDCRGWYYGLRDKHENSKLAGKKYGSINPFSIIGDCEISEFYFNQGDYNNSMNRIQGLVVDKYGKPIENAVINYELQYSGVQLTTYSQGKDDPNPGWFICCTDDRHPIIELTISAINAATYQTKDGVINNHVYSLEKIAYDKTRVIEDKVIPITGNEFHQAEDAIYIKDMTVLGNDIDGGKCKIIAGNSVLVDKGDHFLAEKGSRVKLINSSIVTNCTDMVNLIAFESSYQGEAPILGCELQGNLKSINKADESIFSNDNLIMKLYPVPSTGLITIEINDCESMKTIKIFNSLNEVFKSYKSTDCIMHLDLNTLQKGLYYVQLLVDGKVITQKLLLI